MKKILVLILVLSFSNYIYAQGGPAFGVGDIVTVPGGATGTLSSSGIVYDAAGNAIGVVDPTIIGNGSFAERMWNWCTNNPFACVMAGLGAAQVVMSIIDRNRTKEVRDNSQCQGAFCNGDPTASNPNNPNNPNQPFNPYTYESPDPNDPMTPVLRNAQNILNDLKTRGYEVKNDGSVKKPDGSTMTPTQIASAAANMSAEDQAKLAAIQAEAAAEGKKFADAYADGSPETGGGGSRKRGGGGDGGGGSGFDMNAYLRSLNGGSNGNRGVAGLSVRMGTDSVGVRESNIFEQVSAAYVKDPILNRRDPGGP